MRRGEAGSLGLGFAVLLLIACIAIAFTVGRFPVSLVELAQLLLSKLTGTRSGLSPQIETVIWQIRGPRILAAVLTGGALAIAGTAFQGLFRNPLVSPDILGASSGAALGAVLGIFFLSVSSPSRPWRLPAVWRPSRPSISSDRRCAAAMPSVAGFDRCGRGLAARRMHRSGQISRRSLQPAAGNYLLAAG